MYILYEPNIKVGSLAIKFMHERNNSLQGPHASAAADTPAKMTVGLLFERSILFRNNVLKKRDGVLCTIITFTSRCAKYLEK